jgi:glutathione synthase/RimK-type ligase-like ATP-grasp enzyme
MILILANREDVHARHITKLLERRGRRVVSSSRLDFGQRAFVTLHADAKGGAISLQDGTTINSDEVSAVWHRRPGGVRADPAIRDELDRAFVELEWRHALDALFTAAFRRNVSPPLNQRAATKPMQLALAAQVGLRVPETLITSDPDRAAAFVAEHQGAIVHKALAAPPHRFLDTRAWDADAARHLDDLALCPTILQELIVGPADIRATVIGKEVFSACVETARGRAGVDSRLDPDAPCTRYALPRDVELALLRLMDELGLVFGTIDLKLANNGEHVFLEVNPQGQFLYIEILTGLPISNALAEFLASE